MTSSPRGSGHARTFRDSTSLRFWHRPRMSCDRSSRRRTDTLPNRSTSRSVKPQKSFSRRRLAESTEYHDACQLVDELHSDGKLSEADVAAFARQGKFVIASVAIARLADMPVATVEHAMAQDRPDMVLMLAKVAGLSWTTTKALLRLCKGGRGIPQHDLDQWMARYERIELSTAEQVLRFRHMRRRTDKGSEQ